MCTDSFTSSLRASITSQSICPTKNLLLPVEIARRAACDGTFMNAAFSVRSTCT